MTVQTGRLPVCSLSAACQRSVVIVANSVFRSDYLISAIWLCCHRDGRLHENDQILAINSNVLDTSISHQQAISLLQRTSGQVTLVVARDVNNSSRSASASPSLSQRSSGDVTTASAAAPTAAASALAASSQQQQPPSLPATPAPGWLMYMTTTLFACRHTSPSC